METCNHNYVILAKRKLGNLTEYVKQCMKCNDIIKETKPNE